LARPHRHIATIAIGLARHPLLGSVLALKGGTAFNLCFGPPQRLSVDLDYNYIGHLDRAAMLEARPVVEQAVVDLARRHGYRVQQLTDAFAGRKYYLLYRSVAAFCPQIIRKKTAFCPKLF